MRVLHLTDFHFKADINSVAHQDAFVDELLKQLQGEQVDFIFFTGDLVNAGDELRDFYLFKEKVLDKIASLLSLPVDRIFICPGNHDVARRQEMEAIKTHIDTTIKTDKDLDSFVKGYNSSQFLESCKNTENYFLFAKDFFKETTAKLGDDVERLYSTHIRQFEDKKLGIVSINTAWRSCDEHDKGNLLFPIATIQQTSQAVKDCDIKLLLLHHPLEDFKGFNYWEAENIIFHNFQFMFSGHVHKRKHSIHPTSNNGIFWCVAPATVSLYDPASKIGYTILDIDIDTFEVVINSFTYDKQEHVFHALKKSLIQVPVDDEKAEQNKLRKIVREKFSSETSNANDLFLSVYDQDNFKTFEDLFSQPILKKKSKSEILEDGSIEKSINIEDLINSSDNYLIYGKDKSGKSSLLKKVQLLMLKDYSESLSIPYFIDFKEYEPLTKRLNIISELTSYYQMSKSKLEQTLEKFPLKLLIDNYNPHFANTKVNDELNYFLTKYPTTSFIVCSDYSLIRSVEQIKFDAKTHIKLYLHDITRQEIRSITNKWPNIPSESKEKVIGKIIELFAQLYIPCNYWSVSLFLWVFEKTGDLFFNNNIELIDLYIDSILEKKRRALDRTAKLSFDNFKSYLGELAHYLVTNHQESAYSAPYSDIISFTESYRKVNRRFVIQTEDIVHDIIERGILKKKDDTKYTFRLNGIFEYFLAYHMKDNPSFKTDILKDDYYYLSFGNEMELYSGFSKTDEEFLSQVYARTQREWEPINEKFKERGSADLNLISKVAEANKKSVAVKLANSKSVAPLAPSYQDELLDSMQPIDTYDSDVHEKRLFTDEDNYLEKLEKHLFILSRVYRNTDRIRNEELTNEIFNFILNSSCNLSFEMIEEAKSSTTSSKEEETQNFDLYILKLAKTLLPLITQVFFSDALGHINLERIIIDRISDLKSKAKENQFKLFILYYTLIDIDLRSNKKYFDEVINVIKMPVLQSSSLIKLKMYTMLKAYNDKQLESFLNTTELALKKNIDPSLLQTYKSEGAKDLQRQKHKFHKQMLAKRARNRK